AKAFGGTVYVLQQSSSAATIVVSTISAPSGGTITGLPGLTNDNTAVDFYMIASGNNGAAFDILYVSTTAGITKYSKVAGNWTSNGSFAIAGGVFALAAQSNGAGEFLYGTLGSGAIAANTVVRYTDSAGYNAPINVNIANNVTLYTAPAGTTVKGIAFAPV